MQPRSAHVHARPIGEAAGVDPSAHTLAGFEDDDTNPSVLCERSCGRQARSARADDDDRRRFFRHEDWCQILGLASEMTRGALLDGRPQAAGTQCRDAL